MFKTIKTYTFCSAMLLTCTITAVGQEVQDKQRLGFQSLEHVMPIKNFGAEVYDNPALQSFRYKTSLNTLSVGYDYRHATSPKSLEQGDGHGRAFANIDAYLHKGKATLWGKAYYGNGSVRNVRYNETSDYMMLYPYLMADTVGGKSQQERYHFMGGFSYPLGKRWLIGAEGQYTALMEYRTRDPRPKNLTGDLRAKLGLSYHISNDYWLGIGATARKYKQTNEVKLYNEVSVPVIYHHTGLGNDYYRFRGENTSTYYKGYGVGGMITLSQKSRRGVSAQLEYEYSDLDKIISSLNQLPMANMKSHHQSLTLGYIGGDELNTFGIKVKESYEARRGTENIFGTAQDNIYPQIAEMKQYHLDRFATVMQLIYQHSQKTYNYGVTIDGGYTSYAEKYMEPFRKLKSSSIYSALGLRGNAIFGRWVLLGGLNAAYHWSMDNQLDVSEEDKSASMFVPVAYKYAYLSSNRWMTDASVEVGFLADSRVMPFLRLNWQYDGYLYGEHQNCLLVSAGIRF